jgi:hypothetical protein
MKYILLIRGKQHEWGIPTYGDPQMAQDMMDDGLWLEEVHGSYPDWLPVFLYSLWDLIFGE